MAEEPHHEHADDGVAPIYSGEVWTDARGYATVALPRSAHGLHGGLVYQLRPCTRGVTAEIAAELMDGHFTIATNEPHVKVAWKATVQTATRKEKR